jgi:hypothetical protein
MRGRRQKPQPVWAHMLHKDRDDSLVARIVVCRHRQTGITYVMVAPGCGDDVRATDVAMLLSRHWDKQEPCRYIQHMLATTAPWHEWLAQVLPERFRSVTEADAFCEDLVDQLLESGVGCINRVFTAPTAAIHDEPAASVTTIRSASR